MGCCRGTGRSQRNGFQLLASEAFPLNRKHDGIIKDAVKGTQQRVIFTEVLLPLSRVTVAGKSHVVTINCSKNNLIFTLDFYIIYVILNIVKCKKKGEFNWR